MRGLAGWRTWLQNASQGEPFEADFRLIQAYSHSPPPPPEPKGKERKGRSKEAKEDRRKRGWHALFNTPWREIARYRAYLRGETELATHQVVKGSEFKHVMVIMGDEEAGGTQFSYDKLFSAEELVRLIEKTSTRGMRPSSTELCGFFM